MEADHWFNDDEVVEAIESFKNMWPNEKEKGEKSAGQKGFGNSEILYCTP